MSTLRVSGDTGASGSVFLNETFESGGDLVWTPTSGNYAIQNNPALGEGVLDITGTGADIQGVASTPVGQSLSLPNGPGDPDLVIRARYANVGTGNRGSWSLVDSNGDGVMMLFISTQVNLRWAVNNTISSAFSVLSLVGDPSYEPQPDTLYEIYAKFFWDVSEGQRNSILEAPALREPVKVFAGGMSPTGMNELKVGQHAGVSCGSIQLADGDTVGAGDIDLVGNGTQHELLGTGLPLAISAPDGLIIDGLKMPGDPSGNRGGESMIVTSTSPAEVSWGHLGGSSTPSPSTGGDVNA